MTPADADSALATRAFQAAEMCEALGESNERMRSSLEILADWLERLGTDLEERPKPLDEAESPALLAVRAEFEETISRAAEEHRCKLDRLTAAEAKERSAALPESAPGPRKVAKEGDRL